MDNALVQLYTGDGKGKTTAAAGLALRAHSRGLRVLFAQFMKDTPGGEPQALSNTGIALKRFHKVKSPLFNKSTPLEYIREAAIEALGEIRESFADFDLIVLDEFCHLLRPGLITPEEAREFIASRPAGLELVLTGRGAPDWLVDMADLVTEMREVKHPASRGLGARKGIEY